ncbi:dynein regulatory complex protein 1 [Toxotes jaculatrix]|uniref:dynein regulatory complex protein 1 n=1 Tax=Toxotes jaculatrix TaxID=941984 RepID=UPI001B3AC3B1|nr:dynein regulatory complex protein 1 [Toxotes jaculatrix]
MDASLANILLSSTSSTITSQRITNLQRDLTALVTNIQTAADARESMRRMELEEARRTRLERLENDVKSSQEKYEEITRGWSMAKEKVIPQELHKALNSQQQLCALLLEDKKKLINDLQQELKVANDRYVKDLRRQAEELDLMMEGMEEQTKTLTKAYREEMAKIERVYQQESEVLLARDKTEWEQQMKEIWDKETERKSQTMKKVEEHEAEIHRLMLETIDRDSVTQIEQNAELQVLEREHQRMQATNMVTKLKLNKEKYEEKALSLNVEHLKNRISRLQAETKNLKAKYTEQLKQLKSSQDLFDYKHNIQKDEHIQKKIRHFALADVWKCEEMWQADEAEVKQQVKRALLIDSLICKQHLGLAWEPPLMAFMDHSCPIQPQTQAHGPACQAVSQLNQTGQGTMDASDWLRREVDSESTDMVMCKEGTAVLGESDTEVEEEKLSMETLKKVMELLCDDMGFLMEAKLLKLLAPLKKDEQTVVKLGTLLCSCGIGKEDVPKLAHFLLKYKLQQREQTEDVCGEPGESNEQAEAVESSSTSSLTSDLINRDHVLPALKSFLKQHMRSRYSL